MDIAIKKTLGYKERDEEKRREFKEFLNNVSSEQLIYLDESGFYEGDAFKYGWNSKGKRLEGLVLGRKKKSFNLIGALQNKKLLAPFIFEGSCNTEVFNEYAEKILKPILKPGTYLILDNASFHRSSNIIEIAKEKCCVVRYLPPYSPDLNKIEHYWHSVKTVVRKAVRDGRKDIQNVIGDAFESV